MNLLLPITFTQLKQKGYILEKNYGIIIRVQPTWAISGEKHLSYTTLTRLVECCREYHWEKDVLPLIYETNVDSICKALNAEFIKPVSIEARIFLKYEVKNIKHKSYELGIKILDVENESANDQEIYAIFNIILVFCNTETIQAVNIPDAAANKLTELMSLKT